MRCTAFCTAHSYDLIKISNSLGISHETHLIRDALHVLYHNEQKNLFFFSFGVTVFWGFEEITEEEILNLIRFAEKTPISSIEKEKYYFSYGPTSRIQRDHLILSSKKPETKLAISYALAQSVKLAVFEQIIDHSIEKTKVLPEEVAKKGKISLSRKEISQMIGKLYIERSSINLHSDILDEPEYFWEYPKFHDLYLQMIKALSIRPRIEVLNTRLGIVHELLQILSNQLNHQHSSTLEWTIITLILIEVFLAVLRDLFHII